jgi:alpha-L-rhamnosidase
MPSTLPGPDRTGRSRSRMAFGVVRKKRTQPAKLFKAFVLLCITTLLTVTLAPPSIATFVTGAKSPATRTRQLIRMPQAMQIAALHSSRPVTGTVTLWLPFVACGCTDPLGEPIWAQGETQDGTVALFRGTFFLSDELEQAELTIIADTRFEIWLDGNWLGRGPARFARVRQEFDTFPLAGLETGPHLLAALVQYAPNTRRSESSKPAIQASLRARTGSTWRTVATTNTTWKGIISPAWDAKAVQVSQLNLIGPVEVLDLRQLPADWMQPSFNDLAWPSAQTVVPTPFPAPSTRTIPPLSNVARAPLAIVESGLLSPGRQIIDLEHPTESGSAITHPLVVTATVPTILNLEAIETAPISVDDAPPLAWEPLDDARRPDVLAAQQALSPGTHTLHIVLPAQRPCPAQGLFTFSRVWPGAAKETACTLSSGRTLAIGGTGVELASPTVMPIHDPGRRTLLADPVSGGQTSPVVQLFADHAEVYIPAGDTPRYVVLDFGRTLHARLSLEADGPAGTIVDAGWDERLTAGRPLPNPGSLVSNLWNQVDSWVLDGTRRQLTTLDTRSGRYLLLQVFGPGPVYLRQIRAMEETYPASQIGWFSSSDPLLNTIWQIGVDTLVPNMTDAYTDTPWRERGQWWGDAMIAFRINQVAFGDLALFQRGLRQMADAIDVEGRPAAMAPNGAGIMILDFGMQWIEGLYIYWTLSDDLALVNELYPAAQRLASFLATYKGSAGLLDVPPAHWSQSALVDWTAVSSRSGESTALNSLYAAILAQMGQMAQALGKAGQAQNYFDESASVQQAINNILFLPDLGCYAASRLDGEIVPPSPHAQAWALRYGVVPAEYQQSTVQALVQQLVPFFDEDGWSVVEPLGMFAVLEALAYTNRTEEALDLIRERYGNLVAQGATTWWELFTPNQNRGHSLSHAWGGSPTWFLSTYVLGSVTGGPAQWQVAPHPGNLTHAQGAMPFGSGTLEIAWERPSCGHFYLTVTAPESSSGDILLPLTGQDAQVYLDSVLIWHDGPVAEQSVEMSDQGILISDLAGGEHQVSAVFACQSIFSPSISRQASAARTRATR